MNAQSGTEFRDDQRRRRPLPPELVRDLTTLDNSKAALAVLQTVAMIVLTISAALLWWNLWLLVPAVIIIGTQQHAFVVLAHEAAHYRLFRQRWLNELIGRSIGALTGISMCTYRVVHRLHHNHLYQEQDPDIPLHGGYPRGTAYLVKKLLKDLIGLTAYKTYAYFFGAPAINERVGAKNRPLDDTASALRRIARRDRLLVAGTQAALLVTALALGYGLEYLLLWILPAVTVLQVLLRLRAICEHGAVTDFSSPLTAARTNLAPWWLRWLLFPHHVNYHLEHHLYPAIPQYNLPRCHQELRNRGLLEEAEVRTIFSTFQKIFAAKQPALRTALS